MPTLRTRRRSRRSRRWWGTAVLLAAAAACGGGEEAGETAPSRGVAADAPNVILISLDSARRDLFGVHGGGSATAPDAAPSPRLDALARGGVLFEDAFATSSWTLPSHVSMFTGAPEVVHAVDGDRQRPDEGLPSLPALLRARGYRTAGFFSGPYLEARYGFDRGFDRYAACYGDDLTAAMEKVKDVRHRLEGARAAADRVGIRSLESALTAAEHRLELASHRDVSARRVTDAALAELAEAAAGDAPFFLFAHYFDPHYDYAPPAPWDRAFDPDYDGPGDWDDFIRNPRISIEDLAAPSGRRRVISPRDLDNVRARYAGELAWVDAEIGRLLDFLEDRGLAARTLVVVTADHGDEFFEHGAIGHRRTLFDEVLRVPLFLRWPGTLPAGRRVRGPVSIAGIAATILELVGGGEPDAFATPSLASLARGEATATRGVMGRLVTVAAVRVHVDLPSGGTVTVDGRQYRLLETFRHGAIKVTRERTWVQANEGTAPEFAAAVARRHAAERRVDLLRWIDVERYPAEEEEHHSSSFTDPRARAALEAFQDRYAELLAARARARHVESEDEDVMTLLRGLGYADDGNAMGEPDDALLLFPPPGR